MVLAPRPVPDQAESHRVSSSTRPHPQDQELVADLADTTPRQLSFAGSSRRTTESGRSSSSISYAFSSAGYAERTRSWISSSWRTGRGSPDVSDDRAAWLCKGRRSTPLPGLLPHIEAEVADLSVL